MSVPVPFVVARWMTYVTLLLRHEARRVCRRLAHVVMEQLVQVGLLPECDTRQNNAGERCKLNDTSKRLITSDGRVKIQSESDGGGQVDDPNYIAQIFVTHNFFLKYDFLSMRPI